MIAYWGLAALLLVSSSVALASVRIVDDYDVDQPTITLNYMNNDHYSKYIKWLSVPPENCVGDAFNNNNNVKLLETDPLRKEIVLGMLNSNEVHYYDRTRVGHLGRIDYNDWSKDVEMRIRTIKALAFANLTKKLWYGGPPFSATDFWNGNYDEETKRNSLDQVAGSSYVAIQELFELGGQTTQCDCLSAIILCIWRGSAQVWGAEDWVQLNPGENSLDMTNFERNHKRLRENVATSKMGYIYGTKDNTKIPGDWFTIQNYNYEAAVFKYIDQELPLHLPKKTYFWGNLNCLYLGKTGGDERFGGLGQSPLNDGTLNDIIEKMRAHYNSDMEPLFDKNCTAKLSYTDTNGGLHDFGDQPISKIGTGPEAADKFIGVTQHARIQCNKVLISPNP